MALSDLPVGFYFSLSFNGEDAAFKEVSGISKEFGTEDVRSGGENRFKYRLPTVVTSQNLVLKRALVPKDSQLIKWCEDTFSGELSKPIETNDVSVNLLNSGGEVLLKWTFHNSYPIKYSVADLKSQESEVLMETIELAYTYFDASS